MSYIGNPSIIKSLEYESKKEAPIFGFSYLKESNKFLLLSLAKIKSTKELKMTVWVKDLKFNSLWEDNHKFRNSDHLHLNTEHFSMDIEPSGDVFVAFEHKASDSSHAYSIYRFFNSGMQQQTITIPKQKWQNIKLSFTTDSTHNIIGFGSYTEKDSDTIGTAYWKMNGENKKVPNVQFHLLNNLLARYSIEKFKTRNVSFRESISTEDNGIIMIYEYIHIYTPRRGRTHYNYGDLFIIKLDKDGNVLWEKAVPKYQFVLGESKLLSYQALYTQGNLYLVYNHLSTKKVESYNCIVRLDKYGDLQRQELFGSTYYPIKPSFSKSFNDKMLLSSELPNESSAECLIELDFSRTQPHGKVIPLSVHEEPLSLQTIAKRTTTREKKTEKLKKNKGTSYLGFVAGMGNDCFKAENGTATASFPYQQTDLITKEVTNQQASYSKNYSPKSFLMLGIGLEYQYRRWVYAEGGFEKPLSKIDHNPDSYYFGNTYFGSGVTIKTKTSRVGVRLGARICNNKMESELGQIDNHFKDLVINKHNYTAIYGDDNSKKHIAGNTDMIIVQRNLALMPRVGLEYWSKNNLFIFRVNALYNFSLYSHEWLTLVQENVANPTESGHSGKYKMQNGFVDYNYHGSSNTLSPFSSNNFVFNFQVVLKYNYKKKSLRK